MKKKQTTTTIKTRDELESVMGEYAAAYIECEKLKLEMEKELNAVRQRFEYAIAQHSEVCDGLFEDIQAWAVLNPGEFTGKKSIDTLHGTIGFRTSPPAVKQVPGVKVEHTIGKLLADRMICWIRTKDELDKDAILADYSAKATGDGQLMDYGLKVEQKETFYAEVRHEASGQ